MPRIVILDGLAVNPGDLSWAPVEALGEVTVHEVTPPALTVARAAGAEVLLTNKTRLGEAELAALPSCRYIGVLATGTNVVDLAAAARRGVVVTNVPAYSTASVAQATFALLLELTHHVGHHAETVRAGRWSRHRDFCYWDHPLIELDGLVLGLVGLGHIGRAVAAIGHAMGMRVIAYAPRPPAARPEWVRLAGLEEVFRESDVLSLHCPLTAENAGMVNAERLRLMKPTALLLNTARGGLIDEAALAEALNAGRLAGAGLDVLSSEPPPADNPLLQARNCLITPHLAWATRRARERLMATAAGNLKAFLDGRPVNVVAPP